MTDNPMDNFILNAGGPAFPAEWAHTGGGTFSSPGMTLRDWFAGQTLVALLSYSGKHEGEPVDVETYANVAYEHADAMLAERAKP